MSDGNDARCHRSTGSATGPAGRKAALPGILDRPEAGRFGSRVVPELRSLGRSDSDQARVAETLHQLRVVVVAQTLTGQTTSHSVGDAGGLADQFLHEEGNSGKGAVSRGRNVIGGFFLEDL